MNEIKRYFALTKKLASGEKLSDEDLAFVGGFDLQKATDSVAADARRKAEADATASKAEAEAAKKALADAENAKNEKLTGIALLEKQVKDLLAAQNAQKKESEELRASNARALRAAKVREIAQKHGISFHKKVDASLMMQGFEKNLAALKDEDLDNDELVGPLVNSFAESNEAALEAASTPGAGLGLRELNAFTKKNPFSKKTFNLTDQIAIEHDNPELAKALEASAETD